MYRRGGAGYCQPCVNKLLDRNEFDFAPCEGCGCAIPWEHAVDGDAEGTFHVCPDCAPQP